MKKINYLGWGLNLGGRHILGVRHHRTKNGAGGYSKA